jgi:phosphinothricin acetyltransferase
MFLIRPASPGDAAAIAAIYAPYVTNTAISFETTPPDAVEIAQRMTAYLATHPWLVADDGGRIAGYVYAGKHRGRAAYNWSAEVTAYLHSDYHRQGLGTRLYRMLFEILQRQGFHALFAQITLPNVASVALHRALGMTEVGIYREVGFKFGRWHDVMSMGMTLSPDNIPTVPPVQFARFADSSSNLNERSEC